MLGLDLGAYRNEPYEVGEPEGSCDRGLALRQLVGCLFPATVDRVKVHRAVVGAIAAEEEQASSHSREDEQRSFPRRRFAPTEGDWGALDKGSFLHGYGPHDLGPVEAYRHEVRVHAPKVGARLHHATTEPERGGGGVDVGARELCVSVSVSGRASRASRLGGGEGAPRMHGA